MAKTNSTPNTPDEAAETAPDAEALMFEAAANGGANWIPSVPDVDVVAVPSVRTDGSPDQTPGFVQITEPAPE